MNRKRKPGDITTMKLRLLYGKISADFSIGSQALSHARQLFFAPLRLIALGFLVFGFSHILFGFSDLLRALASFVAEIRWW